MRKINAGLGLTALPKVIFLTNGGKITVSLIQENHHHDHGGGRQISSPSSNRATLDHVHDGDDLDDATSKLATGMVYNPTPLRWCRPPEADFNGVGDHDHVETLSNQTALDGRGGVGKSAADSRNRNSDKYPPHAMIQEKYFFPRHDHPTTSMFLDDHVVEVDTVLRLSNCVSRNPNFTMKKKKKIINPIRPELRWFLPDFFDGIEEDEVDTTLSLRPPGSTITNNMKSRKLWKGKRRAETGVEAGEDHRKKRRDGDEDQRPLIPIELIPGLREISSDDGNRPTFLYRKRLEESDVRRGHNRLFVTRRERMMGFLREEEAAAVDGGGRRLKIVGVDGGGRVYEELGLTKWESLKVTVINSDWRKMVEENKAEKGDVVEIWGYREREKPCFAFNFRRENGGQGDDAAAAASSSGTSCIDEGTTSQV
ncbi:hypothetical protein C2S53_010744 [Perilla frutescens var. hirtella]|uniref:B3 domain-containing protein n=1 Tax=Perilla frutescens var. hirtella TaxID=608512 RepID=A0AAD4J9Q4_PERFH|nr:hypothetical protein C2S53_010744 [Perilla frutescens var. hirtella]